LQRIFENKDMTMKLASALAVAATLALAMTAQAQSQLTDGQVTKVDPSANKITIKHGPMKKFGMEEGMTMVYAVGDPALLGTVKAGDKIKFDAEQVNGQFTVTKIEKSH
jgi:Cu(I)/Ag(I) efflux system periplasmic protein CusF